MKPAFTTKKSGRTERGNALAVFALAVGALATIVGLAIRTAPVYTSEQGLQSIVNEAAWAASGEFKRNYTPEHMEAAAQEVLESYSIEPTVFEVDYLFYRSSRPRI